MRLIVLDTNVIVSAGIRAGSAPAKLIMDWVLEGQVQAVTCPWIAKEYREVARRTKFRRYGFPPLWLELFIDESLHLPDPPVWSPTGSGPKDMPFLALAEMTGAWLISGNLKHVPEGIRKTVRVLSPGEYLEHLGNEGTRDLIS